MTTTTLTDEARKAAETAVGGGGPADRLLERLAELVGAQANVKLVYGEPVTKRDLTASRSPACGGDSGVAGGERWEQRE